MMFRRRGFASSPSMGSIELTVPKKDLPSNSNSANSMPEDQLKVLTLNCWGLKFIASDREARIRGIAEELSSSEYDIVSLQELWVHSDFESVRTKLAKNLPYGKFFFSGALGSGLAIFSRYPIISAAVRPYSLNGSPAGIAGGDWFVGKAVGSVTLAHPVLGELEVFNTHTFAGGGEDGPETKRAHRLVQAWQLADLVRSASERGRYVIVTGDLNSIPTSLAISILLDHGLLTDAWSASHASVDPPPPHASYSLQSAHLAIRDMGVTADSPLNTYSADKKLDETARRWQGKRLDYVLFRPPARDAPGSELVCESSAVTMTGKVPGQDFSFSDHFGFEATFSFRSSSSEPEPEQNGKAPPSFTRLSPIAVSSTLQALAGAYRESRKRARVQLYLFGGCVVALLALIIGSAWLPTPRVTPVFVLLGGAVTWLGTTMLYIGFVFGHWEVRALLAAIEEMELLQSRMSGSGGD